MANIGISTCYGQKGHVTGSNQPWANCEKLNKTFPDFRIVKPYLDQNCNPESRPPRPTPPFVTKVPDPVLQISLLFVENRRSALNGAWNLMVSFHFLSYCFLFFCLLRLLVPFLNYFIPASGFPVV